MNQRGQTKRAFRLCVKNPINASGDDAGNLGPNLDVCKAMGATEVYWGAAASVGTSLLQTFLDTVLAKGMVAQIGFPELAPTYPRLVGGVWELGTQAESFLTTFRTHRGWRDYHFADEPHERFVNIDIKGIVARCRQLLQNAVDKLIGCNFSGSLVIAEDAGDVTKKWEDGLTDFVQTGCLPFKREGGVAVYKRATEIFYDNFHLRRILAQRSPGIRLDSSAQCQGHPTTGGMWFPPIALFRDMLWLLCRSRFVGRYRALDGLWAQSFAGTDMTDTASRTHLQHPEAAEHRTVLGQFASGQA